MQSGQLLEPFTENTWRGHVNENTCSRTICNLETYSIDSLDADHFTWKVYTYNMDRGYVDT